MSKETMFTAECLFKVIGVSKSDKDEDIKKLLMEDTEFLAEPKNTNGCVITMTLKNEIQIASKRTK